MKNGLKKYIAVFCAALIFAVAAGTGPFSVRALAQTVPELPPPLAEDGSGNVTPPAADDTQKDLKNTDVSSTASSDASSQAVSSETSSGESSSSSEEPGGPPEESGQITVTFNLNGGTGMKTKAQFDKGTAVSKLKTPTRAGYRFTGWSRGGVILPDSAILDSDTTLTANWRKGQSSDAGSENAASVDTRETQVDAAASAAKAATSDPGVLSSEDWNSILSASSAQSGAPSSAASQPVSSAASASGGFSTLLAAGIALILLGIAGVIAFICLQFIRKPEPPRGGPHDGSGGGRHSDDDTMTFTDISSYSNGKKPDDASAVLYPQSGAPKKPEPGPQQNGSRFQRSAGNRTPAGENSSE